MYSFFFIYFSPSFYIDLTYDVFEAFRDASYRSHLHRIKLELFVLVKLEVYEENELTDSFVGSVVRLYYQVVYPTCNMDR